MALIVELGTGLPNAESYISVADTDTRLAALGNTTWAPLLTVEKEQALRRATNFMVQFYRARWRGIRLLRTQALDWPRYGVVTPDRYVVDSNVVPPLVAATCADMAFKAAAGDLAADIARTVIREKVGPLETEYSPHAFAAVQYRFADLALAPYLKGGGSMLIRA